MTTLITIHGTNDGLPTDGASPQEIAEKWWTATSDFGTEVRQAGYTVDPFQWSGDNDEMGRRAAGKALYKKLRDQDRAGAPFAVIGHSHGGSVLYHALRYAAARRQALPHLQRLVSVGTPFLTFQRKPGLFERFGTFGRLSIIFIVTSLMMTIALGLTQTLSGGRLDGVTGQPAFVENLELLIISGVLTVILAAGILRFRRYYASGVGGKIATLFKDRWTALAHDSDEAVNSLTHAPAVKPVLVDHDVTRGLMQLVFVLIGIFYIYGSSLVDAFGGYVPAEARVLSGAGDTIVEVSDQLAAPAVLDQLNTAASVPGALIDDAVRTYVIAGRTGPIWDGVDGIRSQDTIYELLRILLFSALFWAAAPFNRLTLGRPAAAAINGIVRANLLGLAYGNSTIGEDPVGTSATPPGWSDLAAMPAPITDSLQAHAVDHAATTLRSIQDALRDTATQGGDLAAVFSGSLTWNELIHTSYFRVPDSRKWIIGLLTAPR